MMDTASSTDRAVCEAELRQLLMYIIRKWLTVREFAQDGTPIIEGDEVMRSQRLTRTANDAGAHIFRLDSTRSKGARHRPAIDVLLRRQSATWFDPGCAQDAEQRRGLWGTDGRTASAKRALLPNSQYARFVVAPYAGPDMNEADAALEAIERMEGVMDPF